MAYPIILTNGNLLVTLADGETNTTACSLSLIGRNVTTYGERVNEDLVHLLENAANTTAPTAPLAGQLWYDTGANALNYRTTGNTWNTLATYVKGASAPTGIAAGDIWYDTGAKKVKVRIDGNDLVVGPLDTITVTGNVTGSGSFNGTSSATITVTLVEERVKTAGDTLTGQLNAARGFSAGTAATANLIYLTDGGVGILTNTPSVALDVNGAIRTIPQIHTGVSGTITIDATYGAHQLALTGPTTIAFNNFVSNGQVVRLTITGTNNAVTWPGTVKWPNNAVPNLTNGALNTAVVTLTKYSGSTNILATYVSY
jgi:hypothetical protein